MAIDRTGISSLQSGAPDIKLTGNQDPREPNQKFAGGGERGWQAQMRAMEIAEEEYGRDFYDLNDSLQHKIYNRALQEIDDMLIGQAQDRGGIQMASAADPILEEQYQQYVFEMEEQGMQPMSFEEFKRQAAAGMADGGIARLGYKDGYSVQGGVKNYLGNQETVSGVPVKWQSGPDKPETELAYITKAEKDLILKKDLHGSLKDGPNTGPGGIMSLDSQGDFTRDRRSPQSKRSATTGPGPQGDFRQTAQHTYSAPAPAQDRGDAIITHGFTGTGGEGGGVSDEPGSDYVKEETRIDDQKPSLKRKLELQQIKANKLLAAQKLGWLPSNKFMSFTGGLFNALQPMPGWLEDMTEEEFNQWLEAEKLNPANMPKTKFDVSQYAEGEDLMGRVFAGGPFNEPTTGGGGDGGQPEWMRLGYPSYAAYLAAMQGGMGGVDTTPVDTVTGFPTEPIRFAGGISPVHDFTGIYGQRTIPMAADGGRIGYAGGGLADLRQAYGLGKLVKKIGKTIGKVAKSPIGMAALGTLGFGLAGMGPAKGLAGSSFKRWLLGSKLGADYGLPGNTGFLGKMLLKPNVTKWSMANLSPWKTIGLGSLLGGAYTKMTEDEEEENDLMKQWLAQKQYYDNYFAPVGDPANFQRIRFAADGGRIGYDNGGDVGSFDINKYWENEYAKYVKDIELGLNEFADTPMSFSSFVKMLREDRAQGGRIGYAKGGNDEEDHRSAALTAMYRPGAQEGGLMDMGGMEKDYRNEGGFVPIGGQERADDVPARLSKNEFVFTADAVRNAGGGDIDKGAEIIENLMENLEQGGKVSEESQGLEGARNMFATSQRLEGVL